MDNFDLTQVLLILSFCGVAMLISFYICNRMMIRRKSTEIKEVAVEVSKVGLDREREKLRAKLEAIANNDDALNALLSAIYKDRK